VFYEIVIEPANTNPIYWAEVNEDGSYSVWGAAGKRGKCNNQEEAEKEVEVFMDAEYARHLQMEKTILLNQIAEIDKKLNG
jgi:hypothetical protein